MHTSFGIIKKGKSDEWKHTAVLHNPSLRWNEIRLWITGTCISLCISSISLLLRVCIVFSHVELFLCLTVLTSPLDQDSLENKILYPNGTFLA